MYISANTAMWVIYAILFINMAVFANKRDDWYNSVGMVVVTVTGMYILASTMIKNAAPEIDNTLLIAITLVISLFSFMISVTCGLAARDIGIWYRKNK